MTPGESARLSAAAKGFLESDLYIVDQGICDQFNVGSGGC